MQTIDAILSRARERIAEPSHWTQNVVARKEDDTPCLDDDPLAVKWCLAGSIMKELGEGFWKDPSRCRSFINIGGAIASTLNLDPEGALADLNDTHTHEEVIDILDLVIERVKESPWKDIEVT